MATVIVMNVIAVAGKASVLPHSSQHRHRTIVQWHTVVIERSLIIVSNAARDQFFVWSHEAAMLGAHSFKRPWDVVSLALGPNIEQPCRVARKAIMDAQEALHRAAAKYHS